MALPTPELSWDFDINLTSSAGLDGLYTHRNLWYNVKNALLAGTSPWTVISSSDGSVTGSGDLWTSTGSINWSYEGSPHSWIILKQTGLGSNFQILISCDYTDYEGGINAANNSGRMLIVVSNADGFTGGTVNNRPLAADEHVITNKRAFPFTTASPYQAVAHVLKAQDGSATHMFFMYGGFCQGWIMFQKVTDAPAAWDPAVVYHGSSTENAAASIQTYNNFYQNPTLAGRLLATNLGPGTSPKYGFYMTTEGMVDGALGEYFVVPNDLDNSYPITPIGIVHTVEVGKRGRHGRLKDIWYGQSSTPPAYAGATYPADGSKQFIQFAHIIFPWDGSSTPIIG